jgi:hypothetical protein
MFEEDKGALREMLKQSAMVSWGFWSSVGLEKQVT